MDSLKRLIGTSPPPEDEGVWEEINRQCSLSWEQRLWGFGICFSIGMVLSLLSAFFVTAILTGHPEKFAILYSFGAFCSIGSSMFLMGPWNQLKSMFAPVRALATIVYLASIILTLVVAFKSHSILLVLMMIVIQFLALLWYCLSYIPYGREFVTSCCRSTISV
eukprot:TRINITY_DN1808_c0_g4_i1.p1 TRINITY_DN1808_c0_g4~~TRINITY_DN1808_c0_g4_i1.p1  ORF type:complete len:164 (-),score=14.45 TRINITY_DN1808_c0_g4_i1:144-635(-)